MSKPGPRAPSWREVLSTEDEELWETVARSLEPVRRKERVHGALELSKFFAARPTEVTRGKAGPADQVHLSVKPRPVASPEPVRPTPPPAGYDWRRARKLAAGRIEIEARLDLHGMRQSEAHLALRAFLLACYAKGLRNVLVITGKGGAADDASSSRDFFDRRERGILKRNVPRWLAEPELRAIVVGHTAAHARHGGEGALYLQLRSRERIKDCR